MNADTTTPETFDVASIASQLVGTWRYPADDEPTGTAYLHFTADGRTFQFFYDQQRPDKRIPMRLYYSVESCSTLRLRSNASPKGWTSQFSFDGTTLMLTSPTRSFRCTRVTLDEIPEWFREALAKGLLQP